MKGWSPVRVVEVAAGPRLTLPLSVTPGVSERYSITTSVRGLLPSLPVRLQERGMVVVVESIVVSSVGGSGGTVVS